jgi:hypothetical protein
MITGFNTDIDFDGQTFHVQTEDKGVDHPVIETLVYTGGQIVCARKTPYAELVAADGPSDTEIQQRMEAQHRALIQEIRDGTLTKEDLEPFGWNIISNQSFDQVVRTFIEQQVPLENIRLDWLEPEDLRAGERPTLRLAVTDETSERPVIGARVVAKLVGRDNEGTLLFSALTDACGSVETPCDIPPKPGVGATLVCEAEAAGQTAEVRRRVKRRVRASVQRA